MQNLQKEKKIVLDYLHDIDNCKNEDLLKVISNHTSENFHMRCSHPFNELKGAENVANHLWIPIKDSFNPIQRRLDIFYAGINSLDENRGVWISSMGHLMGVFNKNFFGLQPNFKTSLLRFAEFYKVENNKITEGAIFLDIFNFMQQLGLSIIPESTGLVCVTPGPMNHKGLKFNLSDSDESIKTLNLIHRMRDRLVKGSKMKTYKEELELDWKNDMVWWGPGGIGASYTIDGYFKGHAKPFQESLEWTCWREIE
ncbi:nuclear transport factor 2 family protein [bacterium]|nr:nuclear transport factor 2 family protein [bacterium]